MFAARNIKLCTKDCACLMVCPTGATDTENGQIDESKCLDGCRLCVDACPSHAIYLVAARTAPRPAPPAGTDAALDGVLELASKLRFRALGAAEGTGAVSRFMKALAHSAGVLGEDCWRERGYLSMDPSRIRDFMDAPETAAAFQAAGGKAAELSSASREIAEAAAAGIDLAP